MKVNIDLPWGGKFEFEREKHSDMDSMDKALIVIFLVAIIGGFALLLSAGR